MQMEMSSAPYTATFSETTTFRIKYIHSFRLCSFIDCARPARAPFHEIVQKTITPETEKALVCHHTQCLHVD